jgi:hypothetical protein
MFIKFPYRFRPTTFVVRWMNSMPRQITVIKISRNWLWKGFNARIQMVLLELVSVACWQMSFSNSSTLCGIQISSSRNKTANPCNRRSSNSSYNNLDFDLEVSSDEYKLIKRLSVTEVTWRRQMTIACRSINLIRDRRGRKFTLLC